MIKITLPNGAVKEFDAPSVTALQVAESIGPRLAKDALGGRHRRPLADLSTPITKDASLALVTPKADEPNALYLTRHSAAHVMAEAITRLFPQTKLAYGPPVDTGFYYDMELDHKLTADDFIKIEEEMKKILAENRPFTRYELAKDAAFDKLNKEGNPYKLDNAERALRRRPQRHHHLLRHRHPRPKLGRPLPRAPRPLHRPHRRHQSHVRRRRLLAWR